MEGTKRRGGKRDRARLGGGGNWDETACGASGDNGQGAGEGFGD